MSNYRRRKSPITGKWWTMPEAAVQGFESYQKVAKRHMKQRKGSKETQRAKGD